MTKGVLEQMLDLKNAEFAINHKQKPQSVEAQPTYRNFEKLVKKGTHDG